MCTLGSAFTFPRHIYDSFYKNHGNIYSIWICFFYILTMIEDLIKHTFYYYSLFISSLVFSIYYIDFVCFI